MLKLKYYYTFKSINNTAYRVEILENTELEVVAMEIANASAPFVVSYQDVESKLETVLGSGAKFAIVGKSTFEYLDLYTANIQQYQVRLLKNGSIIWAGWLDTEYYQENFSLKENIDIDLTAADFNVLERIQYLQADGKPYEGIVSFFDVLKEVLVKLGLPLTNIYIGSATTATGVTLAAAETLLHKVYAINRNYYDEDYKALDCRSVLEGILKPYCLTVKQVNNELFIYDIETLLADNPTFKRYNATTFAYVDTVIVACNQGDLTTIGLTSSDSVYATIGSYNRLTLKYNTFKQCDLGEAKVVAENVSELVNTETVADVRNGLDYSFKIDYYNKAAGFNIQNIPVDEKKWYHPAIITPTGEMIKNEDSIAGIMMYPNTPTTNQQKTHLELTAKLPVLINEGSSYALKISAQLFVATQKNLFADKNTIDISRTKKIVQVLLPYRLYFIERVEYPYPLDPTSAYYHYNSYDNLSLLNGSGKDKWTKTTSNDQQLSVRSMLQFCSWGAQASIENAWTTCKNIMYPYMYKGEFASPPFTDYCIPLPAGSYGELKFCLIQGQPITVLSDGMVYDGVGSGIDYFKLLNDIKLSIVDVQTGKEIELSDVEYNSYINKNYKNDADAIEVIQGINAEKFPNENGAMLLKNEAAGSYYFASTFTRAGATDTTEKLHLRTFISNYKVNTSALSCEVNSTIKPLGYVTYSNHLPGKPLGVYGFEVNYSDEVVKICTKEILKDSIGINTITYEPN
jgi:hypothetical protein